VLFSSSLTASLRRIAGTPACLHAGSQDRIRRARRSKSVLAAGKRWSPLPTSPNLRWRQKRLFAGTGDMPAAVHSSILLLLANLVATSILAIGSYSYGCS
jgi:hypothetical protein